MSPRTTAASQARLFARMKEHQGGWGGGGGGGVEIIVILDISTSHIGSM